MTFSAAPVLASDARRFPVRYVYSQAPQPMGRTLRRSAPDQDFSDLAPFVTDPFLAPALAYKVASLDKGFLLIEAGSGFLLIEAGSDGVVFAEDGRYLKETAQFSTRDYRRYDLATLRAQAQTIDEEVFLGIDPGWTNYYHWMVTAVGRMMIHDRVFDDRRRVVVADFAHRSAHPGRHPPGFARAVWDQTLHASGVAPRLLPLKDGVYRFRRLDVAWLDYPQPAFLACLHPFQSAMRALRRRILAAEPPRGSLLARAARAIRGAAGAPAKGGRHILVRKDADRLPDYADAVVRALQERRGFTLIRPEELDFCRQAALFSEAEIIVSPHGAGLTNLVLGGPQLRVIELNMRIRSNTYIRPWFYLIADGCGSGATGVGPRPRSGGGDSLAKRGVPVHQTSGCRALPRGGTPEGARRPCAPGRAAPHETKRVSCATEPSRRSSSPGGRASSARTCASG
ncbi:glycosyltransferase family 61 protein [Methylorubrum sp. SB2]|uniref:glycosyltransferase family 61 protein n=1 Tax=Methylorubrum subtropicum TaxID=3138812 RepID=UPI00313B7A99